METLMSACGIFCNECPFFEKECKGCFHSAGKPFWTTEFNMSACPLFDCSINQKGLKNCGGCAELPCKMFREMKDPNMSDAEHQKSLIQRVNALKGV